MSNRQYPPGNDTPWPVAGGLADAPDSVVLDWSMLQELLEALGDLDKVVSIYRTFLDTASTLIESLPAQDCATQATTLHTLKGCALMVGAERMARLAARLQHVVTGAVHPIIKTCVDELSGELDIFRQVIAAHLRSCPR